MCVCAECQSVDTLFPRKRFPLRQGDLDSLCMPYAVLNALNRMGELGCVVDAEKRLKKVICSIPREEGKLVAAITKGFNPVRGGGKISDVNWVADKISRTRFLDGPQPIEDGAALLRHIGRSKAGCIVFFEHAHDEKQSHYTFVRKGSIAGVFELWDSYGFQQLRVDGASARVDGKPIVLKYAWPTI